MVQGPRSPEGVVTYGLFRTLSFTEIINPKLTSIKLLKHSRIQTKKSTVPFMRGMTTTGFGPVYSTLHSLHKPKYFYCSVVLPFVILFIHVITVRLMVACKLILNLSSVALVTKALFNAHPSSSHAQVTRQHCGTRRASSHRRKYGWNSVETRRRIQKAWLGRGVGTTGGGVWALAPSP